MAEDLYIGDLFKKSLAHAYKTVGRNNTYIISSKYGLIRPWTIVKPYEKNDGDFQIEYYGGVGWEYEVLTKELNPDDYRT